MQITKTRLILFEISCKANNSKFFYVLVQPEMLAKLKSLGPKCVHIEERKFSTSSVVMKSNINEIEQQTYSHFHNMNILHTQQTKAYDSRIPMLHAQYLKIQSIFENFIRFNE